MNPMLGIVAFFAILICGTAYFVAAYFGIARGIGAWWPAAAIALAIWYAVVALFISIGAFFVAMNVWGWAWPFALIFAAPGLLILIPGAIAGAIGLVKR